VDRSTPARIEIENELDARFEFMRDQVEQRRWYGFWNFGDVMHSYDRPRHVWRYDTGGYAWHNAELAADLWLWHHFLRSGRADAFRMAEAMTRHVSEVDTFHLGPWAPLGSRHNVVHWGCPCKEQRVSVAAPKRFLYFLTADERIGELLWEVAQADQTKATNEPTEPEVFHARIGPTWASFCSNWLAAWERSGDARWRDKILAGIPGILASPYRLLTGTPFIYDPKTGAMTYREEESYLANRLVSIFGGAETWMELAELLKHQGFSEALAEYGEAHAWTAEESRSKPADLTRRLGLRWSVAKLAAWAAARRGDRKLARRAWQLLLEGDGFGIPGDKQEYPAQFNEAPNVLGGPALREADINTNHGVQWCLNAIACLALAPEALEEAHRGTRQS
jgi:hypothetical protein